MGLKEPIGFVYCVILCLARASPSPTPTFEQLYKKVNEQGCIRKFIYLIESLECLN